MKIKNKYTSIILVAGIMSNYCIVPISIAAQAVISEIEELNSTLLEKVSISRAYFDKYKLDGDRDDLEKSLKTFGDIAEFIKYEYEIKESLDNEIYKLFIEQREELYLIENTTGETKYILDYASYIIEGWKKNRHMTPYSRIFLHEGIIKYNKNKITSIEKELKNLEDYYFHLLLAEWETPEEAPTKEWFDSMNGEIDREEYPEFPDVSGPPPVYDEGDEPEPPTSEDMGQHPDTDSDGEVIEDIYSTDTYYEKEGNKCMRVTRTFKDNEVVGIEKEEVPKEDYAYCGIYDYIFEEVPPPKEVEIDEDYIYNDQNIESDNYIYYTVNKSSINAYYYNTGIRATLDGRVTYNQLRDSLYQISLKSRDFYIDSNNKALLILEGKPVVVSNKQETYTKGEVERLLSSFENFDLKVREYVDSSTSVNNNLFENINKNSSMNIVLDGKQISVKDVQIENSTLMISLNKACELFGFTFKKENGIYTVSDKEYYIEFTLYSRMYTTKDNKAKQFISRPIDKGEDVYVDLETLLKEMSYSIKVDNKNLKLIISKNNR